MSNSSLHLHEREQTHVNIRTLIKKEEKVLFVLLNDTPILVSEFFANVMKLGRLEVVHQKAD